MDLAFFKRHPVVTGAVLVVGGLVVVFILFSGRGGAQGVTVATATRSDAAEQQYKIAQLQVQGQSNTLQAMLQARNIDSETAVELRNIDSSTAIQVASLGFDLESLKANIQKTIGLASIDSQNQVTAAQLEAVKIGSSQALEQSRLALQEHDMDLRRQNDRDLITLQDNQLQRAYQSEKNYFDFQSAQMERNRESERDAYAYQNAQNERNATQQLVTTLVAKL